MQGPNRHFRLAVSSPLFQAVIWGTGYLHGSSITMDSKAHAKSSVPVRCAKKKKRNREEGTSAFNYLCLKMTHITIIHVPVVRTYHMVPLDKGE